jgi:asparagine N-glycosylation enzyme membrane subunit Stt3
MSPLENRKIKNFRNYFYLGNKYREEFRKQMRMFIIFTLGFTIAFTWRETIFDLSKSFVNWITHSTNPNAVSVWASVFITFLCLILIFLTTRWLRDKREYH